MAVELATAYISIVADTNKLADSIKGATSKFASPMVKNGQGLGSSLMKGIGGGLMVGAGAAAAAGVATLGVALTKGFSRLNSLDQATAKLEGLGHSAESVDAIMQNALASVRGTAFGMDEAAGVAAGVVAAGVKPGQELERTLKLVADASTIAGTSMGDMGAIFNKVAGTGKIQGEVIAQLGERGIPILQLLAEEMGVSAEEVGKLAAAGEIDFARFQNAMEAGMGGAALKSGETFQGAMANVNASLGRIGAGLLGGTFDQLAPTIAAITTAMGPLEGVAAGLGEKLGEFLVPAFESFRGLLDGGFDFSPFMELAGYLSPIGVAFKVLQPVLPQVMSALGEIAGVVGGALGSVLTTILPFLGQFVEMLAGFAAQVIPVLLPILTTVAGVFGQILSAVMPLVSALLAGLMPVFQQLLSAILPILTPLLALLQPLLDLVMVILTPLIELLTMLAGTISGILQGALSFLLPIIQGVADMLGTVLTPIITMLQDVLGKLIGFLVDVFTGDWEGAWENISGIFVSIWEGLKGVLKGVVNGIIDLINGMLAGISGVGGFLSDVTGGAISFEVGQIPHLAEGATIQPRRGGTLAVLAEAGRAESVVDTGLLNRALAEGINGSGGSGARGGDIIVNPAPGMDEYTIGVIAGREQAKAGRGF